MNRRLTTQSPKTTSTQSNTKKIPKEFKPYRYDHTTPFNNTVGNPQVHQQNWKTTQNIKNLNFKNTSKKITIQPPQKPLQFNPIQRRFQKNSNHTVTTIQLHSKTPLETHKFINKTEKSLKISKIKISKTHPKNHLHLPTPIQSPTPIQYKKIPKEFKPYHLGPYNSTLQHHWKPTSSSITQ